MNSVIINSSTKRVEEVAQTVPASEVPGAEHVQIDTEHQPGSSAPILTDEGKVILREIRSLANRLRDAQPESQSPGRKVKKNRTEYDVSTRAFDRWHMAEHGEGPSVKPLEVDDQSLARTFVATAILDGDPKPTQGRLAEVSGLSQPTWSRALGRMTFWEAVYKITDVLWNLHVVVQMNIARISHEQEAAARKGIERKPDKHANTGRNVVEDTANARIDLQRYEKMDKEQLIRVIQKRKPSVKTEDLEMMTPSLLLRAIARLEGAE